MQQRKLAGSVSLVFFIPCGSMDGDGSIAGYAWDFGDGATDSGIQVSHAYTQAGSYQVTLTVTDDGGLTGETMQTVQIGE